MKLHLILKQYRYSPSLLAFPTVLTAWSLPPGGQALHRVFSTGAPPLCGVPQSQPLAPAGLHQTASRQSRAV